MTEPKLNHQNFPINMQQLTQDLSANHNLGSKKKGNTVADDDSSNIYKPLIAVS